jgi:spore germination protein YaaH
MARNVGRYVAPIALVAVIVATVLVIRAGLDATAHTAPAHHADRAVLNVHAPPRRRFYVIRPGDTLSTISVKTGVSVPTLETLNSSVDPNALQTGQRLRLRR